MSRRWRLHAFEPCVQARPVELVEIGHDHLDRSPLEARVFVYIQVLPRYPDTSMSPLSG